ncbi:MAG: hypothetical protein WDO74_32705 [Pseudomonadota bacterium]
MNRLRQLAVWSLAAGALFSASTACAEDFAPVNDIVSARLGGVVTGDNQDAGYQHLYRTGWAVWLRLQFGGQFGDYAHVALAWEPRLGVAKSSNDLESTMTGITPFEILGGSWIPIGKNRGMVRAGYYWDYGNFVMTRARYDWGGGAVEGMFSFGHAERASLAYRLRLSRHWLVVAEARGQRISYQNSFDPPDGTASSRVQDLPGYGGEALLSIEVALDPKK